MANDYAYKEIDKLRHQVTELEHQVIDLKNSQLDAIEESHHFYFHQICEVVQDHLKDVYMEEITKEVIRKLKLPKEIEKLEEDIKRLEINVGKETDQEERMVYIHLLEEAQEELKRL